MSENIFQAQAPTRIIVNTATRRLHFYYRSRFFKTYPVGVGKPNTPTPTGNYKIICKLVNPGGVFGSRWMGLNIPGGKYGIHGTNNPASIGHYVSLGCIRMYNRDIEEIFPLTPISTPVKIICAKKSKTLFNSAKNNLNNLAKNNLGSSACNSCHSCNSCHYSNNHSKSVIIYTAQPGDTLWAISRRFNIPLQVLVQENNIGNPDLIYPGQKIIIPQQ